MGITIYGTPFFKQFKVGFKSDTSMITSIRLFFLSLVRYLTVAVVFRGRISTKEVDERMLELDWIIIIIIIIIVVVMIIMIIKRCKTRTAPPLRSNKYLVFC